jgi:proteasome lid subunit RPN8/RPN11
MTPTPLCIARSVHQAILEHARQMAPLECCGLLGGRQGTAERYYPLRNELASPVRYQGDASDMLAAFRDLRERELELVAIYHSHPTSAAVPSRIDLENNFYDDIPHLILSLAEAPPALRAYRLGAADYTELEWQLAEVGGETRD